MLRGHMQRVAELGAGQRDQMYCLLEQYFCNLSRPQFEHDLAEKEWVALLTSPASGEVCGFSTLMRLHTTIAGREVLAFFSGDTIIDRAARQETALPRLLWQHTRAQAQAVPDAAAYWFLICSGYKTYRFLPLFFREFYPTHQRPTPPAWQQLLDTLASHKFGSAYDAAQGIVRLHHATPLRPGVAEMTPHRLQDPHIAFFAAANPGHVHGDELACLTALDPANLTAAGRRMLLARPPG